ncbi:MAG: PDZ domain-containing protein [Oscillospiraceae bacterium]|nr:PDZ domain-containing protein [Oscillospiraceae bacterium]
MNKKLSVGMAISLIAIACAITYVVTITVSTNMFNRRIGGVTQREEIYSKIEEIDTYVRNASYYDIDEETLISAIVNGYVDGLSDSHAEYLTAAQAYKRQQLDSGTLVSIGVEVSREESGYLIVDKIYVGSPADSLDIRVGDIITEVAGSNVLEIGAEAAMSALDGDDGTNVRISVQRSGETITLTATRRSFIIRSVSSTLVSGYGYIRIDTFNGLTGDQFVSELQSLEAQGVYGYVIDVRGTDGTYGCLQQMLSRFISAQLLANARYKDGTVAKFLEVTGEATVDVPVVVIADESTSGAAELFTVCMKDFAGAKVVGKQTAGHGEVTETKNLSDGTAIVLTTAELLPTGQTSIEGGVKVDFSVDLTADMNTAPTETAVSDPQVKKAFEVLESMKNQ